MAASSSARSGSRAHVKSISNKHGAEKKRGNLGELQKKVSQKEKRNLKFTNPTPGQRFSSRLRKETSTGPVKSSSQSDKAPPVTGRIQIQRAARQAAELGLTNDCIGDPSRKLLFMLRLGLSPKSDMLPFPVVSLKPISKEWLRGLKTSPKASLNRNNAEPSGGCELLRSAEKQDLKAHDENRPGGIHQAVHNKLQEKICNARPRPFPVMKQLGTTGAEPVAASPKSIVRSNMKVPFQLTTKDVATSGRQSLPKTKANAVVKLKKLEDTNLTLTRRAKLGIGRKNYEKSSRSKSYYTKSTNATVSGKGKVLDFIDISED